MSSSTILLLSGARGIYIPRDFVESFDMTKFKGITEWQIKTLSDPENEGYWDAWNDVLSHVTHTSGDGHVYHLHQDDDLWLLCYDEMTAEERSNFGMEEA